MTPKFSARTQRLTISATASILNQSARLRAEGRKLLDFGVGEPDFPTPEHIKEAAIAAIRNNQTRYTAIAGTAELRAAIASAHARDFGSGYVPSEALATVGGKQALFDALGVLVDHGDEVIVPAPYWVSYRDLIRYTGGEPVIVPCDEAQGFALDLERIARAVTARTKAVILNSPGNPSGAVAPPDACRQLLALCRDRGIWLISDECYAKLVYDAAPYSIAAELGAKDCVVIAGSLSKTYSMTGWRLGYALAPEPVVQAMEKLQSQSTSNAVTFVQQAAVTALLGPQEFIAERVAVFRRRRDAIVAGLRAAPGVACTLPSGAFYAYPNISALLGRAGGPATPAEFSQRLLAEQGVVTVPGEAFGTREHIRFAYATADDVIAEGMRRFQSFSALLE